MGISFQTYNNWCKEDPDFAHEASEEVEFGRQEMADIAEQKLLEAVENTGLRAVMFYLKTRAKVEGIVKMLYFITTSKSKLYEIVDHKRLKRVE